MISRKEIEDAIVECESGAHDFETCQKLATFYEMQDHLYGHPEYAEDQIERVSYYGDTEFLKMVSGMDAEKVWAVLDELMETLKAINPRLYRAVLRRLTE